MNISYNWLKEYLDFDLTPVETADALTSIGLETGEVTEVQTIKGGLKGLVIGEVLTCTEHPNSDHLHVTTVNVGQAAPLQIVCGAPNVAAGQKVVVAVVGTKLYDGEECITIKRSKIRGVESLGMICAEDEIGIGTDHSGIIVLPEEAVPGTEAADYYQIKSDYVLEVDITPNRVDATSHYGVARDLAAYLQRHGKETNLHLPSVDGFKIDDPKAEIGVRVVNHEACPRYSGLLVKGVTVKESPDWLQNKLRVIGLRPINNIVDITNYILHGFGMPMHCFDADKIKGNEVVIDTVPAGTKFTTLDGVERTLTDRDLMICNAEEPMCIGGVFGGLESGVTEQSKNVFLEAACFHPTWIRKTARRFGLNTDASFRFERGLDANNTIYAIKRAAMLLKELGGGTITGDIQDDYLNPVKPYEVHVTYEKINTLIGKVIPKELVKSIVGSLQMEIVAEDEESLTLHVPVYRIDVTRDVDVIEDILRIYGYNNVEFSDHVKANLSYKGAVDRSYQLQNLISEQLTGNGFYEIMNNSLTRASYYESLSTYPVSHAVRLMNPLSADLNVMRQTLLFGGLESVEHNIKHKNGSIRFYEFGNCYDFNADKHNDTEALSGYSESLQLGIWMSGHRVENNWAHPDEKMTVYELKAHVLNIFRRLGVKIYTLVFGNISNDIYSVGMNIKSATGRELGTFGVVSEKICKQMDIDHEVYYGELSWTALMKEIRKNTVTYYDVPRFPAVKRDLALLVDKSVAFVEIEKAAYSACRKMLKEVTLFDVYEGKNLPAGKKSYAVSFWLQDTEKTMSDQQIDGIMQKIEKAMKDNIGAELR